MKNTFRSSLLLAFVCLTATGSAAGQATLGYENPKLWVTYPKNGQTIGAVDSTFILGGVAPCEYSDQWELTINGEPVAVHRDGGWLAWVAIEPGEFTFELEAELVGDVASDFQRLHKDPFGEPRTGITVSQCVTVNVPEPLVTYPSDTLQLGPEYMIPAKDVVVSGRDVIEAWVQGTPGCRAWFSIPGVVDSVPMAETDPRLQAYWGESVFGAGAVPDSLKIAGIYSGFYDVPDSVRIDRAQIRYFLAPPDRGMVLAELVMPPYDPSSDSVLLDYLKFDPFQLLTGEASWHLTINSPEYPFAVRFTDSVQIVRHGPRRGYLTIHQPEGVEAMAVGRVGDWYRLRLSRTQFGWAHRESVRRLPKGIMPPTSLLRVIRTYSEPDRLLVEFPLAGKHPFRIVEDDSRTVRVVLYGVTADTDWIRYDFTDNLVDLATWSQPEEGRYELTLHLTQDIWGYDTYYVGNRFYFQLNRPPKNVEDLSGKVIVIDPGHSRDPGAIGPTYLTEAMANLGISLVLRDELEDAGATVVMTRDDMRHVDLYDRPALAKIAEADLFISVHNNALPDGVNPFENNGTSSFYYHPHSLGLARAIHAEMLEATELPDHGLFHGNLAVIRPTEYPAVLVECAFMMIPEQEAALKTYEYRRRVAGTIREGIETFLRSYADANPDID